VRVLRVTAEMHAGFYNPPGLDLLEYAAKNAAARRARGRFVLFTNPDDCLAEPLAAFLARRRLRRDAFYSTVRVEAPPSFRGAYAPASRLPSAEAMARAVARRAVAAGAPPLCGGGPCGHSRAACEAGGAEGAPHRATRYAPGALYDEAAGDFLLVPREAVHAARGFPEIPANCFVDGTFLYALAAHGYGQLVLDGACTVHHQSHAGRSFNTEDRSVLAYGAYGPLAQALLDEGPFANHRAGAGLPPEARPLHQWNDAGWGLADAAVAQAVLVATCAAP
jgi:GT2 family glycosyltransferase